MDSRNRTESTANLSTGANLQHLLREVDFRRSKNPPALFFLHEKYCPQVFSFPLFLQGNVCVSCEGSFAVALGFSDLPHEAHHGSMVEVFAGVLAPCYGGVQSRFRNGKPHFHGVTFCRSFQLANLRGEIALART